MEKLHPAIELGRYLVGSAATKERKRSVESIRIGNIK
jgi:hypothetical protein